MISVIIPVLNEEKNLIKLLPYIDQRGFQIQEIIVVDGGSTDATLRALDEIQLKNKLIVISSPKSRAVQMNAGAAQAKGEILYFLHADTYPPKQFDSQIIKAVNKGKDAGCFRLKFDSSHLLLQFCQWFTRFNFKACRGGDQSLFVKNEIFEALGGFNEVFTIYEDCEFIGRLYDKFQFTVLHDYIFTSARNYKINGTWKLQYHFTVIHLKRWMGANPKALSAYYKKHVKT